MPNAHSNSLSKKSKNYLKIIQIESKELHTAYTYNLSMTQTLRSLFNYELGEFVYGGLARARVNLEISVTPGSVFQFPISRNLLTTSTDGYFDRLYRRPRCNLSRFSNDRRTNQHGGYEKSNSPDANAELYSFLAASYLFLSLSLSFSLSGK